MTDRQQLKSLLVSRSLKVGDFRLSSGTRSDYYIDARRTTMSAHGQVLTGRVCLSLLEKAGWDPSHVGGLTMGADPIAYAIAHESWLAGTPRDAFSVRKQAKEHGTGQRVEGGLPTDARVVVIEDSMTSGGSALQAVEALVDFGVDILGVLTLVDREEGGEERLSQAGYELLTAFTGRELLAASRNR